MVITPCSLAAKPTLPAAPVFAAGLERDLLNDAQDGELQRFSLPGAALVAGGMTDTETLAHTEAALQRKLATCVAAVRGNVESAARGQLALAVLHTQFLTGQYRPECTELQTTLRTGDYNCVTATVLYVALCQELDLPATIVTTPGHVFARVQGSNGPTESTPWAMGRAPGASNGREITTLALVGKIYYNRAIAELETRQFAAAVRSLRLALALDASDTAARENLLAALNNWALAQCDVGEFAAAGETLAQARDVNPLWPALLLNDVHVHQRWATALCQEGRYGDASELLARCSDRRPDIRDFAIARAAVERAADGRAGK